jgi:hypothetical protein
MPEGGTTDQAYAGHEGESVQQQASPVLQECLIFSPSTQVVNIRTFRASYKKSLK